MPNDEKKVAYIKEKKFPDLPFMDTYEPKKPTGNFRGGLVEPKGRSVKVTAPGPAEEPTKSFGINVPDKSPIGPSIRDKSE